MWGHPRVWIGACVRDQIFGKMGKEKKDKRKSEGGEEGESKWDELVSRVGPIANPLASRKLTKRLYKCIKKGKHALHE